MLGIDRWLALVAARRASTRPTCILNAGTAFTVDALDAHGRHLGGLILPGVQLMHEALAATAATGGVPTASLPDPYAVDLGGDAAMSSASAQADVPPLSGPIALLAATAERAVRYLAERTGLEPRVVLTGGDSVTLAPLLSRPPALVPDLVMTGLALVATERCA
jgi:type III pantothenate kinase